MTQPLPPLADRFIVMQVDEENRSISQPHLGYNQDDPEEAQDAAEMLKKTVGGEYAVMRVSQSWHSATFPFTVEALIIQ